MTPEEINRKIADCLGYKWKPKGDKWGPLVHPWIDPEGERTPFIPDFYHDLNACAEMVKGFNLEEARKFSDHLKVAIQRDQFINSAVDARYMTANATAPQRCEAFLRTKGLWVEKEGVK